MQHLQPPSTTIDTDTPPGSQETPRVGLIVRTSKLVADTLHKAVSMVDLPASAIRLFVLDDIGIVPRGFPTIIAPPNTVFLHGDIPAGDEALYSFVSEQFAGDADHFYLADLGWDGLW